MKNGLFEFRDDDERDTFFIAIPVIALFAWLGYWMMQDSQPPVQTEALPAIATDSDNDGVTDASDQCINTAGIVSNYGCPAETSWADKDNDSDGIRNEIDRCPETRGKLEANGCAVAAIVTAEQPKLDTDNDGVYDTLDECPTEPAQSANGCPVDTDGDGIADTTDDCVEIAGNAENNGCPADSDNDGVIDIQDQCQNEIGTQENQGCPEDSDNDGVNDLQDLCPSEAAATANGCPDDADNDGITGADDQCPQDAGLPVNAGCPADTDSDGVSDADDRCPENAGAIDNQGCPPDSDGDGIADQDDICPNEPGSAEQNGCASDSDGLQGCPQEDTVNNEEVKRVLDAAIAGVKFNSSSSELTARTRNILRTVAELLQRYPDSTMEIRGHTDSSGNPDKNMELSMQRARACAQFIASQGINADRLKAYGYGDSQPVAENNTSAGREANRRVEFELR